MAFGSDHAEPACGQHQLALGFNLAGELLDRLIAFLARGHVLQLVLDPEFKVAAQLDVGPAPGHVGGDGHRTEATGLRHDMGFHLVEAGVQHRVLDPFLIEEFR